jgi:outer membrane protein OmpA-like peptidoglycan-associated protein
MRALVISTVVGAMVLSGCQTTGKIGGVEYDKAALGTLIGAAAGYGISKGNANSSRQNNRAAAIGAVVGGASGFILTKREKLRQQMAGTGVEVNRNPDGSVGLVMPGNITFDTNKSNIKPNFYSTLNKVAQTLLKITRVRFL